MKAINTEDSTTLNYSGKEDDPGSRKQNQETQILDSKLAWMIHCVIYLDHFGLVTTGKLPAKYPRLQLPHTATPSLDALIRQLVPISSLHCQPFLCPRSIHRERQGKIILSTLQIYTLQSFAATSLCEKAFLLPVLAAPFVK